MAKTGWTFEYMKSLSQTKIEFMYRSLKEADNEQLDGLATVLGLRWTRSEAASLLQKEGTPVDLDVVNIPLSFLLSGDVAGILKKVFKSTASTKGVEEMGDWGKDKFKDFIGAVELFGQDLKGKPNGK